MLDALLKGCLELCEQLAQHSMATAIPPAVINRMNDDFRSKVEFGVKILAGVEDAQLRMLLLRLDRA